MARVRNWLGLGFAMIAAALVFSLMPVGGSVAAAEDTMLRFAFEGTVKDGPSTDVVLEGELALTPNADGTVEGGLTIGDATIPVSGRLAGTNIDVAFDLGDGVYIFGIGRANDEGVFRGPFVGPADGDFGRWVAKPITTIGLNFSGEVTRGPSTGVELAGDLNLDLVGNRFTGALVTEAGEVPVSGRLFERHDETRIRVIFDLGDAHIIGRGVLQEDGSFVGPFRGPDARDRGEWVATP